jgi:hypothetical protein
MSKLEYYLHFFGYAGGSDDCFEFYDYKGTAKPENVEACLEFKKLNEKMLEMRV